MDRVQGFRSWSVSSEKVLEATWSSAHQGIESHIARYRNSPVMHASVPDEQRPALFKDGLRIPFPAPTKKAQSTPPTQRSYCVCLDFYRSVENIARDCLAIALLHLSEFF